MEYIDKKLHDLLKMAIELSITDIHFDITEVYQVIRLRRHKQTIKNIHDDLSVNLYEHLKYISRFDLSQNEIPQTGSFTMIFERRYFFRFASIESFGRKNGVIRILNIVLIRSLSECISNKRVLRALLKSFSARSGLILFSGATGSGKSTTMFNTLKEVSSESIYSVESPIEHFYNHVIQLEPIESRLTQEDILNQLLRMDADIIVYGEVRTKVDLRLCLRAVNMGHLVCASIHSRSCFHTLDRLYDLGATHYEIESGLIAILYHYLKQEKGEVFFKHEFADQVQIRHRLSQSFKDKDSPDN
ncbi:ATPase, T2SS/T4P/T4SS family [Erysipelothrix rhusiopathiae]|uniref:ATPase, T2SS/T4P/T4SS family n=1 Tax=Erysipelothrix rhusiopathiae TaxID=1648 RepID=UPI002B24893C|nr:ATPase, T2SS/T4P/T4SS family [Erysipelothrix rhusiopathiae]WRB92301.1 ATPase, T2SS/T4P/T4SS family [Erysipelothrix rhusiopathiae]